MLKHIYTAILVLSFGLLATSPARASELYKWQDEDGVWHYSSTPPPSQQPYDTLDMPAEEKALVTLSKMGPEREPEYSAVNHSWAPVELELQLHDARNVVTEPALPTTFVIPGQSERRLLKVRPLDPYEGFSLRLSYRPTIGPPLSSLPPEFDYYPPFPLGLKFPISQGFDNDVTHSEPPNQYAVDIVMPVGTPVLAARAGRVVELVQGYHGGGQNKRFLSRSNMIRILHDDGTMAVYAHLQANSARVRDGDEVEQGQWIANSGNTGYSSGPHLHFVVQLNAGMSLESLPFRFVAPGGNTLTPENRTMIDGVLPN